MQNDPENFYSIGDGLTLLAPIPMLYKIFDDEHHRLLNDELIAAARSNYREEILEVPDVRHAKKLGAPPPATKDLWASDMNPAIGVWHQVPTNSFLELKVPAVVEIKSLIEAEYINALSHLGYTNFGTSKISESWIQFYKNGDYKVLHNHERYYPPLHHNAWAGGYYLTDGGPDADKPLSGVFSFSVRNKNYYVRPKSGLLLMWPSDILHEVHPFYGASERIIINWNIATENAGDKA